MLNEEERKREKKYCFILLEESTYSSYTTSTGLMSRFHSCSPARFLKSDKSCLNTKCQHYINNNKYSSNNKCELIYTSRRSCFRSHSPLGSSQGYTWFQNKKMKSSMEIPLGLVVINWHIPRKEDSFISSSSRYSKVAHLLNWKNNSNEWMMNYKNEISYYHCWKKWGRNRATRLEQ